VGAEKAQLRYQHLLVCEVCNSMAERFRLYWTCRNLQRTDARENFRRLRLVALPCGRRSRWVDPLLVRH